MRELIDALLLLARVTQSEVHPVSVDLSALAGEITAGLRVAHPGRDVDVVIAPDPRVRGDRALLRTRLVNLLDNAWKYTEKRVSARVKIGSLAEAGERVFFVRDDGAGFDAEHAERLVHPFQRLHSERDFAGTGIGLATAARIVPRHGGRIWAVGAVGQGATFSFVLSEEARSYDEQ